LERLREQDNWCGETHLQKTTYFLQELAGVELGLHYIFYKYGPFSFDLKDEMVSMLADSIIECEFPVAGYGPSYRSGGRAQELVDRYSSILNHYGDRLGFVATEIGKSDAATLERLATALYVKKEETGSGDPESRAAYVVKLKPHVSIEEARDAVRFVDGMYDRLGSLSSNLSEN
jgi:uncharacterized protein YwgA